MARTIQGLHKQTKILVQASSSGILLTSATASLYGIINYIMVGWNGASVGAAWKIVEVDSSATATLSNTVQTGYFTSTYGAAYFNLGEDAGIKASTPGSAFMLRAETSGSMWAACVGNHSRSQA